MAVIQNPALTVTAEVDSTFKALRISQRPAEVSSWISVAARSGALTLVAAAGAVFSLRNLSSNLITVNRVGIGFVTTTAFTTAQELGWSMFVARAFTVSDSGGTAMTITGNNGKHRTSLGTPTSLDARIATTGALTAGTRTLDANAVGVSGCWSGALGQGLTPSLNNLMAHDAGDYPLVLALNEGFIISNNILMGVGGVGGLYVNVEFAEAPSF